MQADRLTIPTIHAGTGSDRWKTSDFISALSQLGVMVELAERDREFGKKLRHFTDNGGYIKDLLTDSIAALEIQKLSVSDGLISVEDRCWAALPVDSVTEILRDIAAPDREKSDTAFFVLALMKQSRRMSITAPSELVSLMASLLGDPNKMYLPFEESAIAGISIAHPNQRITIHVANQELGHLLRRLYFSMGYDVDLDIVDPFSTNTRDQGAVVLLIPKFGAKISAEIDRQLPTELLGPGRLSSEEAAIASIAGKGDAITVALVSSGVLSRSGRSRQFRKWLVETAGLTTVIELPERLLDNTSIGCAILVIDPESSGVASPDHVLLLSGESDEFVSEARKGRYVLSGWRKLSDTVTKALLLSPESFVGKSTLAENDFLLQPSRYSARKVSGLEEILGKKQTVPLTGIADIRSPLPVRSSKAAKATEYAEVRISDFETNGTIVRGSKVVLVSSEELNRIDKQILKPGDILIGTKGTIGKSAVVSNHAPDNLIASQTTAILRVKTNAKNRQPILDPVVLHRYLSLPEVRRYLESLSGGATISFLRKKDLADLPIPSLKAAQQQIIIDIHEQVLTALKEAENQQLKAQDLADRAFSDV